jgi:hypothetical protein
MKELRIRVESGSQCPQLASLLRGRRVQPPVLDERSLTIDLDQAGCS